MSDPFHEAVPAEFVAAVWDTMQATPQHTYQSLTKRGGYRDLASGAAERMARHQRRERRLHQAHR
ncbi:DUF5131 family protein [Bradyrhizobium sp. DN5]|uniref:DUF5131 family protein n=1 Tax=Bradyrhizobium sp. DN5 TaxID=3056950 RepID=UPI00352445D1